MGKKVAPKTASPAKVVETKKQLKKNEEKKVNEKLPKNSKKDTKENTAPNETKQDVEEKKDVKNKKVVVTEDQSKRVQNIKDQSCVAIAAMKKYFAEAGGKSLFPDLDHAVHLNFVYKKSAMVTDKLRYKILLPHSHKNISNTSVCLIMPDLDKSEKAKKDHDVDKQAREWVEKIDKDHGLTDKHYAKIFTKTQLEREAHTYADRRALATRYDLFLVDARVGNAVCKFTGKEFVKVHKRPVLFDYEKPLATTIEKLIQTVSFPLNRYMTRASIPVGHLGQDTSDLVGNIAAILDNGIQVCPGGLPNIRAIYLQSVAGKPSLPIYLDNGSENNVKLEKQKTLKQLATVDDECTTLPEGLKVRVTKSGRTKVVKEEDGHAILYPTINDEWDERDIYNTKPVINPVTVEKKKLKKKKIAAKRKAEVQVKNEGVDKKPKKE